MFNKLVGLSDRQIRWLTKEAKRLGIDVTELIRRIVDNAIERNDK